MIKGFILFNNGRIPFVIEQYQMELFTDEKLLSDFIKKYNFKNNYILYGEYYGMGFKAQKITILVERSIGSTCYLSCYLIDSLHITEGYDSIGIQSSFLDDIFRYKYHYLELIRNGINLAVEPKEVYKVPFSMENNEYELSFRIGQNEQLGLLGDFDKKGEVMIPLVSNEIRECYAISRILHRFAMFMISKADVYFKKIILYKKGVVVGWLYCNFVSEKAVSGYESLFFKFDVMRYVPRILNNIALNPESKITQSVPLGHLGNFDYLYAPQRFIEQIMAFEYIFQKLEPKRSKNNSFPLKEELKYMFDLFPKLISKSQLSSEQISDQIKELRRNIVHGYAYYYDFKSDSENQYLMMLLDELVKKMSLKLIGFSEEEIDKYPE